MTAYPIPTPGSGGKFFPAKMTAKDDPTISCSHLIWWYIERSVLAGLENP